MLADLDVEGRLIFAERTISVDEESRNLFSALSSIRL